jgi:hypothetical protein
MGLEDDIMPNFWRKMAPKYERTNVWMHTYACSIFVYITNSILVCAWVCLKMGCIPKKPF